MAKGLSCYFQMHVSVQVQSG